MTYSRWKQIKNFWLVMIPFAIVLYFGYKLQFVMKRSISYFDKFEILDCKLFDTT